jgi:Papain family cysteine protease
MNKYGLNFWLFLGICFGSTIPNVQAQQRRATGLVYNTTQYKKGVKTQSLDGVSGSKARTLPLVINLHPYCPTPQNQVNEPSCAAWATAYGAMTIHHAIRRKVTNARNVDKIAHSKAFVYNQFCAKTDCIVLIEDIFQSLKNQGTCLAATFRNDVPDFQKPDEVATNEANRFHLDAYSEVFDPDTTISTDKQILRLKRLLADSSPVVVGMSIPYSFYNLDKNKWRFAENEDIDSVAHALCLIGYDDIDSTFELMNSWGIGWGNGGFAKVYYRDLIHLMVSAYNIKPHFESEENSTNTRIEVALRKAIKYDERNVAQFEEVRVKYDAKNQIYKTVQKTWKEGTGFQMAIRTVPVGWFVYAFGMSPTGEINIFHQSRVEQGSIEKVIPSESNQLEIEAGGTEYMCVLFSKEPLSIFTEMVKKIQKPIQIGFYEAVKTAFSDALLTNQTVIHERMGQICPKETDKIVALVLSIN